ncbi:Hypothetical protein, putative [Bodo saltans]|uniref:Uncharacterized protein n=1 Tax=Bodo saltans TaxID=75058 RepID=A0A0S4IXV6_BODSA|nr:Hypothetical protein, putative [Bodo saltans]|eukprot:CUG46459.1 Hypothetical protein, putative [Bodo saltans]
MSVSKAPIASAPPKAAPARPVMSISRKADRPSRPAGNSWVEGSGGAGDRPMVSSLRSVLLSSMSSNDSSSTLLSSSLGGGPQRQFAANYGGIVVTEAPRALPRDFLTEPTVAPIRPRGAVDQNTKATVSQYNDNDTSAPIAAAASKQLHLDSTIESASLRVRAPRINAASVDRHEATIHEATMRRLQEENQRALAHFSEHPPSERRRSSSQQAGQSPLVPRQTPTLTRPAASSTAGGPRRASTPEGRRFILSHGNDNNNATVACTSCGSPLGLNRTNPPDIQSTHVASTTTQNATSVSVPQHLSPMRHENVNEDGVPSRLTDAIYGPRGVSPARSAKPVNESTYQPSVKFQEPRAVANIRTQSPQPTAPTEPAAPVTTLVAPRPSSPYRSVPITKGSLPQGAGIGRGSAAITSVSIRTSLLPLEVTEVPQVLRSRSSSPSVANPAAMSTTPQTASSSSAAFLHHSRGSGGSGGDSVTSIAFHSSSSSYRVVSSAAGVAAATHQQAPTPSGAGASGRSGSSNAGDHTSSAVVFQHQSRPETPTRSGSAVGVETIPSSRIPKLSPPRKRTATRQGPSVAVTNGSSWGNSVTRITSKKQHHALVTTTAGGGARDDVPSLSPSSSSENDASPPKARSLSPLAVPRDSSATRTAWVPQQAVTSSSSISSKAPKYCWSCGGRHPDGQAVVKFCSTCGARVL